MSLIHMTDPFLDLQNEIMMNAGLQQQAATGFYETYCPVCGYEKRRTGGFRLDHDEIIYNCFRASCDASCVLVRGEPVSRKFRNLMQAISTTIPPEIRAVRNTIQAQIQKELESDLYTEHHYKQIRVPKNWTPLDPDRDTELADYYLSRGCDPSGIYVIRAGLDKGLSAIPMYHYDKLIGFQVVDPGGAVKYRNHADGNEHLLMINGGYVRSPVILVEGVMDALCFPHAVGTLAYRLSPEKAYQLRGKEVIVFPDKKGGEQYLQIMKDYGWKAYIPESREVGDLNDMVRRYGKIATARMIRENVLDDYRKAVVAFKAWTGGSGE